MHLSAARAPVLEVRMHLPDSRTRDSPECRFDDKWQPPFCVLRRLQNLRCAAHYVALVPYASLGTCIWLQDLSSMQQLRAS